MNKEFEHRLEKIEAAVKAALPLNFDADWQTCSFDELPSAVSASYIQKLIEPNYSLINLGGKRWRPLLLILCYEMAIKEYKPLLSENQAYSVVPMVEFVHTASLIHDDIEDSADLRRGKPAAHITYGLDTALNSASWLYFEAPVCINRLDVPDSIKLLFYRVYTNELRRLHLGQAMDIFWHRNPDVFPSKDEYFAMVKNKTGTLATLAALTGLIAGGMPEFSARKLSGIAAEIGIGFQIIDDVINLTTGNVGKKRGDDIVEGKKSLPVLLHIQERPEDKNIIAGYMNSASKDGIDSPCIEECIKLLESSGCIKKAATLGTELIRTNCEKLNSPLIRELFISMIPENFR